jgi:hypothetical protein
MNHVYSRFLTIGAGLILALLVSMAGFASAVQAESPCGPTYTVRAGDTLFRIARVCEVPVKVLLEANPEITNPNLIRVGQVIQIPTAVTPTPVTPTPETPTPVTPTPTPVTPTPEPDDPWTDPEEAIEVFSPVADAIYHSPIEIIGFSRTFEGNVVVRLRDADGEIIAERPTIGGSVDGYDFFHTRLRFVIDVEPGEVMTGTVEAFEISAEDGSEINMVTIPVLLQSGQRVIDVDWPRPGEVVCQPLSISGYSSTFEANVVLTLSERDGEEVEVTPTMGGTFGFYEEFSDSFEHTVTEPRAMLVSAHEEDARGLGNIDYTRVPITASPCNDE